MNGGVLPAALASRWLTDAWDQNTALEVMSPVGSRLEHVCQGWVVDLLGLPRETAAGFTNGTSAALLCCLAAARYALLERQGWNVSEQGLQGAPRIRILGNRHIHATVLRALQAAHAGRGGEFGFVRSLLASSANGRRRPTHGCVHVDGAFGL